MNNGIRSLPRYLEGGPTDPDDDLGWFERMREGARQRQQESRRHGGLNAPLALRQLTADLLGKQVRERLGMERLGNAIGSRDITAGDLSRSEYEALKDAAVRAMSGDLGDADIQYKDYGTTSEDDPYADVGGGEGSGILTKLFDPDFSMKSTFGQGSVRRDPDTGDYYFTDQYNFNERQPESSSVGEFVDILKRRVPEQGAYGVPRSVGEAYGSPEGEGSMSRINLGDLEGALRRYHGTEEPSRLAEIGDWIGNLFDRGQSDEVQSAEAAQPYDPIAALTAKLGDVYEPDMYRAPPAIPPPVLGSQRKGMPQ